MLWRPEACRGRSYERGLPVQRERGAEVRIDLHSIRTVPAAPVEQLRREKMSSAGDFRARDRAASVFACSTRFSPSVKRGPVSVKRAPGSLSPVSARSGAADSGRAPADGRDLSPLRAPEIAIDLAHRAHVCDTTRENRSPDHVATTGAPVHQRVAALETRRNGSPRGTRTRTWGRAAERCATHGKRRAFWTAAGPGGVFECLYGGSGLNRRHQMTTIQVV